MPKASGAAVKYHYKDHDSDGVYTAPPVQNQWYTLFDSEDVRLLWALMYQTNGDTANKNIEMRWTIDGQVYMILQDAVNSSMYFVYRTPFGSGGGTGGLGTTLAWITPAWTADKRGMRFKVEVRITSALGTNQLLAALTVRETLEQT